MKCPKCGEDARYVVSRKRFWKKEKSAKGGNKPRIDFRAKCTKCKFIFDAKEVYGDLVISQVKVKEPEKKLQIRMKYTNEEKETKHQ